MREMKTTTAATVVMLFCAGSALAQISQLPLGAEVEINQAVVTVCNTDDYGPVIFAQTPERTFGMRLICWGETLEEGDIISTKGLRTWFVDTLENIVVVDGVPGFPEFPVEVHSKGNPLPRPVMMPQKSAISGLRPEGLYVRLIGKASGYHPDDSGSLYIYDGSDIPNDAALAGLDYPGMKVWEQYMFYPVQGEFWAVNGCLGLESKQELIYPVFYPSLSTQDIEPSGPAKYTISGTVTADSDVAGMVAKIVTDVGLARVPLDENGEGNFSLELPEGRYLVSARMVGYGTKTVPLNVVQDISGLVFEMTPIDRNVYVDPDNAKIAPEASLELKALFADAEARPVANADIVWHVDLGNLLYADTQTDSKGRAHAVFQAPPEKGVATIWAVTDVAEGRTFVEFADEGDPSLRIISPVDLEVVSGICNLEVICVDTNSDGSNDLREKKLYVDGEVYGTFMEYDQYSYYFYPEEGVSEGGLDTTGLSNGFHEIWATGKDKTETMKSNVVLVYVQNDISEVRVNHQNGYFDQPGYDGFHFSFVLDEPMDWVMEIRGFVESDDYDQVIWSSVGLGSCPVDVSWDGKVDGEYLSGVFEVSISSNPQPSNGKAGEEGIIASQQQQQPGSVTMLISQSRPKEALICGLVDGEGFWLRHSCYNEMNAAGFNYKKRGVEPTYVLDPTWYDALGGDPDDPNDWGLVTWLNTTQDCSFRYFFLNCHGEGVRGTDGIRRTVVWFHDGVMVYGDDSWDRFPDTTEAFSDLGLRDHFFKIAHLNVCWSMGTEEEPDTSIAWALGARDDELGSTYIGWDWYYKPLGAYFLLGFSPNGEGWTRALYKFLGNGRTVWQAIDDIHHSLNPFYRGYMEDHEALFTWYSAMSTWIEY